ncbi:hypothetical protein [Aquisphaera insulae]|uniref:hypothetical protein n=1 Tax=Aquisphaera insulae TaxID=2712864 RepID=UPI0013E9AC4D|nr:hypothetical protein [Aquisphaera insulae]
MLAKKTSAGHGLGSMLIVTMLALPAQAGPPERIELPRIENAFRLGPRLYSGGEPRGEEAFAALKALGVRTVISVDGATPDVEMARKFGIRYAHLPIGYDGVPREQAIRIVKAARTLPGPVFVHCHHGKHRGPAAAAACGLANEGWTHEQAASWLEQAGTDPGYRGLLAAAREFNPPSPEELDRAGSDFPERAKVPALVDMMVRIDGRWDHLKDARKAGFRASGDHLDADPPHEALQLVEHFRESRRLDEARSRGDDFARKLESAEAEAESLRKALRNLADHPDPTAARAAEDAFAVMSRGCTDCHSRHRDR